MVLRFLYQPKQSNEEISEAVTALTVTLDHRNGTETFTLPMKQVNDIVDESASPTSVQLVRPPLFSSKGEALEIGQVLHTIDQNYANTVVFNKILSVLVSRGTNLREALCEEDKLIIQSNEDLFLNFPWESLLSDTRYLPICREVLVSQPVRGKQSNNNILIYLSHAHFEISGEEWPSIAGDFDSELSEILSALLIERRGRYRKPQEFRILKYLNKNTASALQRKNYDLLHLIMHGDPDRGLGFETVADHWKIDWISNQNFLDLLAVNHVKSVYFLSCCYTAYGNHHDDSLSFGIVKGGFSRYAIGFNGRIGSGRAAPRFASVFYQRYFETNDVEISFYDAARKLWEERNEYRKTPVLYKAVSL